MLESRLSVGGEGGLVLPFGWLLFQLEYGGKRRETSSSFIYKCALTVNNKASTSVWFVLLPSVNIFIWERGGWKVELRLLSEIW